MNSPRLLARVAAFFYVLVFVTGGAALAVRGQLGSTLNLIATICYIVVTALFYELFKPAGRTLSLTAAFFSLVGCAVGAVNPGNGNVSLVFFGCYCILIGCLVLRATFMPRFVGVAMLIAGAGWLTFLWPPLAQRLSPFNMLPGMLGEFVLTLWLLTMGVNAERWRTAAVEA
jgi:hypothetical protein